MYCIGKYLLRHGDFVFGGGSDEHARYALATVVGDLSGYNAVRQCEACLSERRHRRHIAVALAIARYGIVVIRTEFHRVIFVTKRCERLVHRHLRHERHAHAVATYGARDTEIGEIVLVLRYRPLQPHAVVGIALGSRERSDNRLTGGSHTDRRTGHRTDCTHCRAHLDGVFNTLAGRYAFGQFDGCEVAVRVVLLIGRAVHIILHAVEHIRGPYTFEIACMRPVHLNLTAYIGCRYRTNLSEVGIDANLLRYAGGGVIHELAAKAHIESLTSLIEHSLRYGESDLIGSFLKAVGGVKILAHRFKRAEVRIGRILNDDGGLILFFSVRLLGDLEGRINGVATLMKQIDLLGQIKRRNTYRFPV